MASGSTRAAIAVMRISGPCSGSAVEALAGALPTQRRASLRRLHDSAGDVLDHALVLWFPGPDTYTGEDSAELHLHGGRAVIDAVAGALVALGLRPADPGEFTRRAFLHGRMDLTAAEAVHDLVSAETESQRRQALRQMEGALADLYHGWADHLLSLLAGQEALIDYPDEDLPPETECQTLSELEALRAAIHAHLDDGHRGQRLREGLFFVISGAPNVGKSSLINALVGRDVAIVSAEPGTTRDALEARVALGDVPVTLVDTAGLRESADPIEVEGIRRARARLGEADLSVMVVQAGDPPPDTASDLLVANKADLGGGGPDGALRVSALTGAGLDTLRATLADHAHTLTQSAGPPPLTRLRHRHALEQAEAHLAAAIVADLPELRAEDLRLALQALGRITGQVGVEDVLDALFARFCIGK